MATVDLSTKVRDVPDWPQPGVGFKDVSPMLRDPDALAQAIEELAAWARDRGIPLFEVPLDADRLADVIRAGALSGWRRGGGDRRRLPRVARERDGSLVFVDRAGRRWHVYDRRGGDRRQSPSAPPEDRLGFDRVFVDESGHCWRCPLRSGETDAAAPLELERQLARSSPDEGS